MKLLIACFNEVLKLGRRWRRGAIVRMPIDLDGGLCKMTITSPAMNERKKEKRPANLNSSIEGAGVFDRVTGCVSREYTGWARQ